ncbi:MAG: VanZ family protein [Oscillospiraceae bacterium]|nr:VanZ family protein [Oscillospiraceae bacterium]
MKKVFKVLLAISILLILLINLKIIPNPSDFTMTRDIILSRRERGWWQYNFIPFESYFHIGENFPANVWLIIGHIGMFFIFGILLALSSEKISVKKCLLISFIFSVLLEVIQFAAAVGVFDIDTIIQHTLGAFVGVIIIKRKCFKSVSSKNKKIQTFENRQ